MTDHIGHKRIVAELEATHLAVVTLLTGPEGVGKQQLARELASRVSEHNILALSHLTAEEARGLQAFVEMPPTGSDPGRIVVIDLDGASPQALNVLLKLLEEPPDTARFILTASQELPLTITSRAQCQVRLGLLADGEVEEVLLRQGVDRERAHLAARASGGSVHAALQVLELAKAARERMLAAVQAAASGNAPALVPLFREWGVPEHTLLVCWVLEAAVPYWRQFAGTDVPQASVETARVLLSWLGAYEPGSPRITDRAVLERLAGVGAASEFLA